MIKQWRLDDVAKPHALAVGAAPARFTQAGERVPAVYYGEVAPSGSQLRKYIVLRPGKYRMTPPGCSVFVPIVWL